MSVKYNSPFARFQQEELIPFSTFDKKRKGDDLSIKTTTDAVGKELLERNRRENPRGARLREKYLPELPGYQPDKLVNRYQLERYVEKMLALRPEAQLVTYKVPGAIVSAVLGAFSKEATDASWVTALGKGPFRAVRRSLDVFAQAEEGRVKMIQEFQKRKIEYMQLQHTVMLAERRDWQHWRSFEQERAYVTPNRLEWFFLGNALTGIHQDVEFKVGEMDGFIKQINARIDGAALRRQADIAAPFVSGVIDNTIGVIGSVAGRAVP
jgi:hypothetical protein